MREERPLFNGLRRARALLRHGILNFPLAPPGSCAYSANDLQYAEGQLESLKAFFTGTLSCSRRLAARALAAWLAVQILLIAAMAASPALHKAIHHDADDDDHECAVTLFIHGQVSSAVVTAVVAALAIFFGAVVLLADPLIFAPADFRFSSSRAPPLAFSSR